MARNYNDFFAICKTHGFDYKDKVAEFTQGKTDSLRALTDGQYHELLLQMKRINKPARDNFKPRPGDKERKKMISLALQMHWGDIPTVLDLLDAWCRKQKFQKGFNDHDQNEYGLLLTIFEQRVYAHYLRDLNNDK